MLDNFALHCINSRKIIVSVVLLVTVLLGASALRIDVETIFEDLQPTSHEYVKVNEQFKKKFGGSNIVTFMVTAKKGDIFQIPVLKKIQELTKGLQKIDAVNEFQIYSLAGKKLKEIRSSTEGIESKPYMWPKVPKTEAEIEQLKKAVLKNPLVYGPVVSRDLRSTLITVDFYDGILNYSTAFKQVQDLVEKTRDPAVEIGVVGNPVLYGWVNYFIPETISLVMIAFVIFFVLLFIINRTWRGTLLPVLSGLISGIWALGVANLLGINFDPLVVVVAMLITARAISHSVQMVTRFHEEIDIANQNKSNGFHVLEASKRTLKDLLRPGLLGIATDAGCVAVVAISPIPLLQKLAILAIVWISTVGISSVILTPVLLSWVKKPNSYAHGLNIDKNIIRPILNFCVRLVSTRARFFIIGFSFLIFVACAFYSINLKIGDSQPGTPILWPESTYNTDSAAINSNFPGADRMFVVFSGEKKGAIKEKRTLNQILDFQWFMEEQKEIGGTVSIADVLPAVSMILHEGNPRYYELGENSAVNGELMYMFENAAEPGDLDRFVDVDSKNAAVTMYFADRQGKTIRTAIARVKRFIEETDLGDIKLQLAGGVIGLIAAVNEVILSGQIQSIALALFILVMMCIIVYGSSIAGMFFMVPLVLSNLVTFAYMAWQDIGMNINTVPVAALGIGLGVDYSLYITDRIKSEYEKGKDPLEAISISLLSAGRGVLVTAFVLVISVCVWLFSSLKFQAEMGMLIALWLMVSALSALFLMPALAYVFKPNFIFGKYKQ